MKGEPTPAWDHGTRGSSPFWLGEGRVPSENVATLELVVFGDWGTWIPASRKGECGWEASTEYHCTPTKVFLKFSQSLRRPPTVATMAQGSSHSIGSRADQLAGSIYRAQLGVKRCTRICLLVGTSGRGLGTVEPVV